MYFYIGGILYILVTILSTTKLFTRDFEGWHPMQIVMWYLKNPITYLGAVGFIWLIAGIFSDHFMLFLTVWIVRAIYLFVPVEEEHDLMMHKISSLIEINIVALILYLNYSNS